MKGVCMWLGFLSCNIKEKLKGKGKKKRKEKSKKENMWVLEMLSGASNKMPLRLSLTSLNYRVFFWGNTTNQSWELYLARVWAPMERTKLSRWCLWLCQNKRALTFQIWLLLRQVSLWIGSNVKFKLNLFKLINKFDLNKSKISLTQTNSSYFNFDMNRLK